VYFEDLSPWHHLIFCEELVNNDGENDVFCWLGARNQYWDVPPTNAWNATSSNINHASSHQTHPRQRLNLIDIQWRSRKTSLDIRRRGGQWWQGGSCLPGMPGTSIRSRLQMLHPQMHLLPSQIVH
jgi:hypothetical protein